MSNKLVVGDRGNYHVVATYAGDVTKVDLYHRATGLHARGNAKRYHADVYDKTIGYNLAYFRALARLSTKITARMIKELSI